MANGQQDVYDPTAGGSALATTLLPPRYQMPQLPYHTVLLPWEEEKFQKWIAEKKDQGLLPNEDQGRTYDYRAAYKQAGLDSSIGGWTRRQGITRRDPFGYAGGPDRSWRGKEGKYANWPMEHKVQDTVAIQTGEYVTNPQGAQEWVPGSWERDYLSGTADVTPRLEDEPGATFLTKETGMPVGTGPRQLGDVLRLTPPGSGTLGVNAKIRHTEEAMKALGLGPDDAGGDLVTQGGQLVEAIANDPTAVTRGKLPHWMEPITTTGGGLKGGIEGLIPDYIQEDPMNQGVLSSSWSPAGGQTRLPSWDEMYPKAEEAVETVAPKSIEERWLDIAEQRFKPKSMKELIWPAAVQGGLSMLGGWMGSRATNAASRRQEERYQQAQKILEEDRARRMASENYTAQLRHAEEAGIGAQRKRLQAAAIPGLAHGLGYELDQSQFVPPALDPTFTGAQTQYRDPNKMAPPGYVLDESGNPVLEKNLKKKGGKLSKLLKWGLPAAAIAMPALGAAGVPGFGWASKLAGSLFGLGGGGSAVPPVVMAKGGGISGGIEAMRHVPNIINLTRGAGTASKIAGAARTAAKAARVAKTLANAYQSPSPTAGELDAYPWMNQGSTASSTADTGQFQDQSLMDAYPWMNRTSQAPPGYQYNANGVLVPLQGAGWRQSLLEG